MSTPPVSSESRTNPVIQWLLDGDPSIRWQTMRDLLRTDESAFERERRKISRDGWGARLLAKQNAAGTWARGRSSDGLYSPKWISTTYTKLLLRDLGRQLRHLGEMDSSRRNLRHWHGPFHPFLLSLRRLSSRHPR
jgi:hypothetical protein